MQRFWDKVEKTDDCWIWTGRTDKDGYGHFNFEGNNILAHRFAYELNVGPIPDGLGVLHNCDNPPCCNPDHLFTGTPKDNAEDRDRKGRRKAPTGEAHGRSKLTWETVREIRKEHDGGVTQTYLSNKHGIPRPTIGHIVRNETWKEEDNNAATT